MILLIESIIEYRKLLLKYSIRSKTFFIISNINNNNRN